MVNMHNHDEGAGMNWLAGCSVYAGSPVNKAAISTHVRFRPFRDVSFMRFSTLLARMGKLTARITINNIKSK